MNLIVDVGNTNVKLAVFQGDKVVCKKTTSLSSLVKEIKKILKEYKLLDNAIISSVGKLTNKEVEVISNLLKVLVLTPETMVPFENKYSTPQTLGVDRIALVSAAVKQFNKNNVLIIDAGTCITYDFLTKNNEYLGGAISPGVSTRYRSLNNLTANLPLLDKEMPNYLIGESSKKSIHSGVINGVLMEIDGVIQEYEKKYEDLTVILTGGDAEFLSKRLKSSIFANSNFLLEGLNFILEFNSNK